MKKTKSFNLLIILIAIILAFTLLYRYIYFLPRCKEATKKYSVAEIISYYSSTYNIQYSFLGKKYYTRGTVTDIKRENKNISIFKEKKILIRFGVTQGEIICSKYISKVIPEEALKNIEIPEEGWKEVPAELRGYLLPE